MSPEAVIMLAAGFSVLGTNWLFHRDLTQENKRLDARVDGPHAELKGSIVDPGKKMEILSNTETGLRIRGLAGFRSSMSGAATACCRKKDCSEWLLGYQGIASTAERMVCLQQAVAKWLMQPTLAFAVPAVL